MNALAGEWIGLSGGVAQDEEPFPMRSGLTA
jgi:hypothetical protein